jgi:SpoIID/LytB domain protein
MKMKHWAYIGIALIDVNASLLGGLRAAELTQNQLIFHKPAFTFFHDQLGIPWLKPEKLASPVTVRLFEGQRLGSIRLMNPSGFLLTDQAVEGPVLIKVKDGKLEVYRDEHFEFMAFELTVTSQDHELYEVRTRQGSHRLTRGELILSVKNDHLLVVNRLELEDYVSGILEGELGTLHLPAEVLKAQAVVARTYVLSMRGDRHHGEGYEFCDSPHCQVFSSIPRSGDANLDAALASVRKVYISYHGRPIPAFYHHNCGGMTSAVEDVWPTAAQPYLVPVSEGPDSYCRLSPKSQWRFAESRKSLAACFRHVGWLHPQEALDSVKVAHMDASGRVRIVLIQGNRTLIVPVGKLRNVINQYYGREVLKSAVFTIAHNGERFVFRGRGWGHGVGLCQEGSKALARQGKTYQEILTHYFPHTKLSKLR